MCSTLDAPYPHYLYYTLSRIAGISTVFCYSNVMASIGGHYQNGRVSSCTPYSILTPWSRVLLQKLTGSQLVKKFLALYGTRKIITASTIARHLSPSWARSIQSMPPHPTSWTSILILSSHLRLGLQSGPFPHVFPAKPRIRLFSSPYALHAPPIPFIRFYHPNNIGYGVQIIKLLIMWFSPIPYYLVLLGPNILISTLFSSTLSLRSSHNVSDQVSHPYKTTGKNHSCVYLNLCIFG